MIAEGPGPRWRVDCPECGQVGWRDGFEVLADAEAVVEYHEQMQGLGTGHFPSQTEAIGSVP